MKKEPEIFKTVRDFPRYQVSNFGRVIRTPYEKEAIRFGNTHIRKYATREVKPQHGFRTENKTNPAYAGYIRFYDGSKLLREVPPGQLVAETFLNYDPDYQTIIFADGDGSNYCLSNISVVDDYIFILDKAILESQKAKKDAIARQLMGVQK